MEKRHSRRKLLKWIVAPIIAGSIGGGLVSHFIGKGEQRPKQKEERIVLPNGEKLPKGYTFRDNMIFNRDGTYCAKYCNIHGGTEIRNCCEAGLPDYDWKWGEGSRSWMRIVCSPEGEELGRIAYENHFREAASINTNPRVVEYEMGRANGCSLMMEFIPFKKRDK